jgi:hypothetical protein
MTTAEICLASRLDSTEDSEYFKAQFAQGMTVNDAPKPPAFWYWINCSDKKTGEKQKFPLAYAVNTDGTTAISVYGLEWLAFDGGGAWTENPILMAGTIMTQSKFGAAGTLVNLAGTYTQEEPPAGSSINAALAFRSAVDFSKPLRLDQFSPADSSYTAGSSSQDCPAHQWDYSVQSLAPDTSKA